MDGMMDGLTKDWMDGQTDEGMEGQRERETARGTYSWMSGIRANIVP